MTKKNVIQERLSDFSNAEIHQIISEYEQFEKDGFIGDTFLRTITEEFSEENYVIRCMQLFAFEAYRYFYNETFKTNGGG